MLAAIAGVYGSIGRPFQVLSVLAERDPGEHLAAMAEHAEGRRIEKALAANGALYREIAAAQRRLRQTYLLLSAGTVPEQQRALDAPLSGQPRTTGSRPARHRPTNSTKSGGPSRGLATPGTSGLDPSRGHCRDRPCTVAAMAGADGAQVAVGAAGDRGRRCGVDASPPDGPCRGDGLHDDPPAAGPGRRPPRRRAGRARGWSCVSGVRWGDDCRRQHVPGRTPRGREESANWMQSPAPPRPLHSTASSSPRTRRLAGPGAHAAHRRRDRRLSILVDGVQHPTRARRFGTLGRRFGAGSRCGPSGARFT